jgi:hemolysin III
MSSIYHGLTKGTSKKVFQILDHCTIFTLIAGTYTPILLNKFRATYPVEAWVIFGIIWGLAIVGIVLNSIDIERFKIFSTISYLGMGWLAVLVISKLVEVIGLEFFILLLIGGLFYTVGAVLYLIGKKKDKKYMHAVFHVFVVIAALLHFIGIIVFVIPA